MKILFRLDGGNIPEIGTGHMVRCSLLADRLKKSHDAAFAVRSDERGVKFMEHSGRKVFRLALHKTEANELIRVIRQFRPQIVVVDRLDTDAGFMRRIKATGVLLITLDDRGTGAKFADLRIYGMVRTAESPYLGPSYVILPPHDVKQKEIRKSCKKIFISFGGYDHLGLTRKTIEALKGLNHQSEIIVAVSKSNPDFQALQKWNSERNIKFHYDKKNFDEMIENSDLAILSGGLSVYQALSCGVPSVVISQYDHQRETSVYLKSEKAIVSLGLGTRVSEKKIREAAEKLSANFPLRRSLSRTGQGLVDREGVARVANLIQIVKTLPWDTRFFKRRIARLYPSQLNESIMELALRYCRHEKIECLYYLADPTHKPSLQLADENGFSLVDTRLTLSLDLRTAKLMNDDFKIYNKFTIREAKASDIPALKKIARNSYPDTRYSADPHFSRKICQKFYELWIAKSCRGFADKVFVATAGRKPIGYVTCKRENFSKGSLPLVGVHEEFQGMGVGRSLIHHALDWFRREGLQTVEVVTQQRNQAAQKLYQRCGFAASNSELWYHKWFN